MSSSPVSPTVVDPIQKVRDAVAIATRVTSSAAAVETTLDLNQITLTTRVSLADVNMDDFERLIADGHLVDLRIDANPWSLHLRRGGSDGDVTEETGSSTAAVDQAKLDDLRDALNAKDFRPLVDLLQVHEADLTLKIINDPEVTRTHWVASSDAVTTIVGSDLWIPFAHRVSKGPAILLADDLGEQVLRGESLAVYGPQAPVPRLSQEGEAFQVDSPFRAARAEQGALLPSPLTFADLTATPESTNPDARSVATAMRKLTALLIWSLLASSSEPDTGSVDIRISGARQLHVSVTPTGDEGLAHLIEMYRWVATSPEIDRLYFAQQALTLAIVTPEDANSAPEPALRTARSLYDLSRQNAVSEVMAARRSARETALSASRSAATQAREAASKSVERTIVQIVAAAAVVVAQLQDAVSAKQAAGLLVLLATLCVFAAVATDFVILRSARNGLDHELRDLKRYRDTLSKDDVKSAKRTGAVRAARADLKRARLTSWVAYGAAALALSAAAVVVAVYLDEPGTPSPEPVPSTDSPTIIPSSPAPTPEG